MIGLTDVPEVSRELKEDIQKVIDSRTKPLGSLGQLESLVLQIGLIQETLAPKLMEPVIVVFAGDHGVAQDGVSPYPSEVTAQMVRNFMQGGAAINVFCQQNDMDLLVVDAGVSGNLHFLEENKNVLGFLDLKVGHGTLNSRNGPAMTHQQFKTCLERGCQVVEDRHGRGSNMIGFGEMGIGNSTAAAVLTSLLTNAPLEKTVGVGSGCNERQWNHKLSVAREIYDRHRNFDGAFDLLRRVGGFEMVMLAGGILEACKKRMVVLMDGFIASSVALAVIQEVPQVQDYLMFCHRSASPGHQVILDSLDVEPILDLRVRLGEGSGMALAYPLIQSSLSFYHHMASFSSAQVSSASAST